MEQVGLTEILIVILYLFVLAFLGWLGYRRTKSAADYLIAGREIHPFIMAMSYGATFISTAAIVGFGGVAGLFGMSLLWLTFFNIFFGIFVAFVFFGAPTRRMGHHLDAHTFPELLGRRFQSKFIQVFAGLVIFLFIPLYAAAVLMGGVEFIATKLNIDYNVALMVFSVLIAAYIIMGGLKGVMYTDALQGSIMFLGMIVLLVVTYAKVGGVVEGHQALGRISDLVPAGLQSIGHQGWSAMPKFGFGETSNNLWWVVVSGLTLGVGIGVLAQPQLAVRFMTVKSRKQLNRAVLVGGIFILIMTGTAFTVGSLSNVYFQQKSESYLGRVVGHPERLPNRVLVQLAEPDEETGQLVFTDKKITGVLTGEPEQVMLVGGEPTELVSFRSVAFDHAGGNPDQIIPLYIGSAMPRWFGLLFLLTLLAAAMSTLSSQFHALGTSIGRDVYEQFTSQAKRSEVASIMITRFGILLGIIIAVVISYVARGDFIARATAIFFGLCGAAFLPAFIGGLFWRRMTKAGALSSMIVGFAVSAFWLVFIHGAASAAIGVVKVSILNKPNWPVIDPIIIALPLSALTAIVVSLITTPPDEAHLNKCFRR